MYRPQFPFPDPPPGFEWQPCVYQFDQTNVPALGNLSLLPGQETGYIPLPLDRDACFILLGAKIQNAGLNFTLYDPWTNQLMDDFVQANIFAAEGPPFTNLEGPGIEVPAGSKFSVRLQGR